MRPEEASMRQFGHAARHFDNPLTRLFLEPGWRLVRQQVEAHAPRARFARALDLGCGTGALLATLAPRCGALLGLDVAAPMLRVASARGVRGVQGAARALPLRDACIDLVVSSHSAHHFEGPWLGEARRVLRPGGLLVVADLERRGLRGTLADEAARRFEPSHVGFLRGGALRAAVEGEGFADVRMARARAPLPVMACSGRKP